MTDDIVTRLREWHTAWDWYLPDQAADEIERLRGLVAEYKSLYRLSRLLSDALEGGAS